MLLEHSPWQDLQDIITISDFKNELKLLLPCEDVEAAAAKREWAVAEVWRVEIPEFDPSTI